MSQREVDKLASGATNYAVQSGEDLNSGTTEPESFILEYLPTEATIASIPIWSLPRGKHKQASSKTVTREIRLASRLRQTMRLDVHSVGERGLPTTTDLEFFYAVEIWLVQMLRRDGTIPPVVHCTPKTLLRLAGKTGYNNRDYQELWRFCMRMTETTIVIATRDIQLDSAKAKRSRKEIIAFHIFDAVYLPGELTRETEGPIEHIRIRLSDWYRNNLLHERFLVVNHQVFQRLRTPLGKLLFVLLHHLFSLQEGVATQRYSQLVEQWQLAAFTALSRIQQQFAAAHEELLAQNILAKWELRPVPGDVMFVWEAGPAWWQMRRDVPGAARLLSSESDDPILEAVQQTVLEPADQRNAAEPAPHAEELWQAVMDISGRRKDPEAWQRWWRRAIADVPPSMLWHRIGEVRELQQEGRIRNAGSYLVSLVRADARKCRVSWA